eukprot:246358-Amorphochlora_amoeboformis.AAC.1
MDNSIPFSKVKPSWVKLPKLIQIFADNAYSQSAVGSAKPRGRPTPRHLHVRIPRRPTQGIRRGRGGIREGYLS